MLFLCSHVVKLTTNSLWENTNLALQNYQAILSWHILNSTRNMGLILIHLNYRILKSCCCCCKVTSVMSNSVQPHRRQPTRLPYPWDSPGKNTGVGCHFLLQCMKVKSENEVVQSCPTLSDPMDCSLTSSSIHWIFQARVLEWVVISFSVWNPSCSLKKKDYTFEYVLCVIQCGWHFSRPCLISLPQVSFCPFQYTNGKLKLKIVKKRKKIKLTQLEWPMQVFLYTPSLLWAPQKLTYLPLGLGKSKYKKDNHPVT